MALFGSTLSLVGLCAWIVPKEGIIIGVFHIFKVGFSIDRVFLTAAELDVDDFDWGFGSVLLLELILFKFGIECFHRGEL